MTDDKNSKIINQGTFGYTGNVMATIKRNGKVVKIINRHNAGFYPLFRALAGCLIGGDYSTSMPQYLEAYQESASEPIPLRARVKLMDKHLEDSDGGNNAIAVFVATIPYTSLALNGAEHPIVKLQLYNQFTDGYPLAEVNLTEQHSEITLSGSGYSAVIEWRCIVQNSAS